MGDHCAPPEEIEYFLRRLYFQINNIYSIIDFSVHGMDPTYEERKRDILYTYIPGQKNGYNFEL